MQLSQRTISGSLLKYLSKLQVLSHPFIDLTARHQLIQQQKNERQQIFFFFYLFPFKGSVFQSNFRSSSITLMTVIDYYRDNLSFEFVFFSHTFKFCRSMKNLLSEQIPRYCLGILPATLMRGSVTASLHTFLAYSIILLRCSMSYNSRQHRLYERYIGILYASFIYQSSDS